MCRDLAHGGRKCPAHSDPNWIARRNERRRRVYAQDTGHVMASETVVEVVASEPLFNPHQDPSEKRLIPTPMDDAARDFNVDAHAYSSKLTDPDLRQELIDYTSVSFEPIRDYLHDKNMVSGKALDLSEERRAEIAARVERLDRAIAIADKPANDRKLYRGIYVAQAHGDIDNWLHDNYPVGGVIDQKAYMSSSLNPHQAFVFGVTQKDSVPEREIVFEFLTKQGAPLGDETSYMGRKEQEVLLPRNARFQVVAVHRDTDFTYGNNESDTFNRSGKKTIVQLIDVSE